MGTNPSDPGQGCGNCGGWGRFPDGAVGLDVTSEQARALHEHRLARARAPVTEAIAAARQQVQQWQAIQKASKRPEPCGEEYFATYDPDEEEF